MWEESKHPRDKVGRWTEKKGEAARQKEKEAEKIYNDAQDTQRPDGVGTTQIKTEPSAARFREQLLEAKKSTDEASRWRVSSDYDVEDYEGMEKLLSKGGSAVALKPHGRGKDIVSLAYRQGDVTRGRHMLAKAIQQGGDRLDAFGPVLYRFYTRNGFEAVSWTPFNEEYAPEDWIAARDAGLPVEKEPVIFYKYTGKKNERMYEDFLAQVKPDEGPDGYDTAMKKRDKEIDDGKEADL